MHLESTVSQFFNLRLNLTIFNQNNAYKPSTESLQKNRNKCSPIKHISLSMNFVNDDE